jgi:hypothetical protein
MAGDWSRTTSEPTTTDDLDDGVVARGWLRRWCRSTVFHALSAATLTVHRPVERNLAFRGGGSLHDPAPVRARPDIPTLGLAGRCRQTLTVASGPVERMRPSPTRVDHAPADLRYLTDRRAGGDADTRTLAAKGTGAWPVSRTHHAHLVGPGAKDRRQTERGACRTWSFGRLFARGSQRIRHTSSQRPRAFEGHGAPCREMTALRSTDESGVAASTYLCNVHRTFGLLVLRDTTRPLFFFVADRPFRVDALSLRVFLAAFLTVVFRAAALFDAAGFVAACRFFVDFLTVVFAALRFFAATDFAGAVRLAGTLVLVAGRFRGGLRVEVDFLRVEGDFAAFTPVPRRAGFVRTVDTDEVRLRLTTLRTPGPGIRLVSSPVLQRTRIIEPFTAVTNPARAREFEVTSTRSPTTAIWSSFVRQNEYDPNARLHRATLDAVYSHATSNRCLTSVEPADSVR